jgi:anti-sigma factor RsiW
MTPEPDLTCQELVEVVTAYWEDALPPGERARFEAHLRVCAPCRRYLDQLRQTIALTGTLTDAAIAPALQDELLAVFRAWKNPQPGA